MTASIRALRAAPFIIAVVAALCAVCTACGGGAGDPAADADAAAVQVVALAIDPAGSLDALADSAASEHGAPGENEAVQYRLRGASVTSTAAAVAGLRAMGFRDVVAE